MFLPVEIKVKWEGDLVDSEFRKLENGKLVEADELRFFYEQIEHIETKEIGAYVTWYDDPCTNIMLHYMLDDDTPVTCMYRKVGEVNWQTVELYANKIFPSTSRRVKWFKLSGLEPGSTYETKLKNSGGIHKFKTMSVDRDLKILMSSDQMNDIDGFYSQIESASSLIKDINPDVFVIAGDIVHGENVRPSAWIAFWDGIFNYITPKNEYMIPMVITLGNHDGLVQSSPLVLLWNRLGATPEHVGYAYNFFSNISQDVNYNVIDIGEYFSIISLDSGHTVSVEGSQTTWLENVLQTRQGRHIFPFMHVSPYPGRYDYEVINSKRVRESWTPLFTQYGVKVAGSGHEHVSLVTKKVTLNSLDENGVVYIGQGYGLGNASRESTLTGSEWFIEYFKDLKSSQEVWRGFDVIEFKTNNSVVISKVNLSGTIMYSKVL